MNSYENPYIQSKDEIPLQLSAELQDELRYEVEREMESKALFEPNKRINIKFRRMPIPEVLDTHRDQIGRCTALVGHILVVQDKEIKCTNCPAVWKNEGF